MSTPLRFRARYPGDPEAGDPPRFVYSHEYRTLGAFFAAWGDGYPVDRSTGLPDGDGHEVYEGDRVRGDFIGEGYSADGFEGVVIYSASRAAFMVDDERDDGEELPLMDAFSLRVVGHVHEPERAIP